MSQTDTVSKKPPRLHTTTRVDLPVVEASGIATRRRAGRTTVLVVGDRTAEIAIADYDDGFGEWSTFDLSTLEGWPIVGDSQMEAIAVDGGSLVAVMTEDPPLVLVIDVDTRRIEARIALTAPAGSPLERDWSDASSRGEGLVLLRDGRLLVAKEKHPPALVEFVPAGRTADGLAASDFLGSDEHWDRPRGDVEYVAASMWTLVGDAADHIEDVSALAVGSDASLWLLSDKSAAVARLGLDEPLPPGTGAIDGFSERWRLPKRTEKPEGMTALDADHVLVALDTGSTQRNGLVVDRSG